MRTPTRHAHTTTATPLAETPTGTTPLRRRGLIAGAAALAAAVLAERSAQPVAAGTDGDLVLNGANSATATTALTATFAYPVFTVSNTNTGYGADGIEGVSYAASSGGVYGVGTASGGIGLYGNAPSGYGLYALGSSAGVYGNTSTTGGYGVYGTSPSTGVFGSATTANGNGVYGYTTTAGSVAVLGSATGSNGYAGYFYAGSGATAGSFTGPVSMSNAAGIGLNVSASANHAIVGTATGPYSAGVLAQTSVASGYGLEAVANSPGVYAGNFFGKVLVQGDFAVTGAKSAALPHPDGTHRLVYCVEAPESWLEDFGEGTLTGGSATVALDPDFAAVIDTATLHVFCFEHGDNHGLHLADRSATGFTVAAAAAALAARGQQAHDANGTFSYRVVAKRKDITPERLAKLTLPPPSPRVAPPTPPPVPKPPVLPPPPPPREPPTKH